MVSDTRMIAKPTRVENRSKEDEKSTAKLLIHQALISASTGKTRRSDRARRRRIWRPRPAPALLASRDGRPQGSQIPRAAPGGGAARYRPHRRARNASPASSSTDDGRQPRTGGLRRESA